MWFLEGGTQACQKDMLFTPDLKLPVQFELSNKDDVLFKCIIIDITTSRAAN